MDSLATSNEQKIEKPKVVYQGGSSDSVYGLGFIGALVFYLRRATSFQTAVIGFFKAMVWPAILVYEVLKILERQQPRQPDNKIDLEQ